MLEWNLNPHLRFEITNTDKAKQTQQQKYMLMPMIPHLLDILLKLSYQYFSQLEEVRVVFFGESSRGCSHSRQPAQRN